MNNAVEESCPVLFAKDVKELGRVGPSSRV